MNYFKSVLLTLLSLIYLNSYSQTALPASGTTVGASTGSWLVPANVYSITINGWGGGGAGAGQSTTGTGGLAGGAGGSRSTTTISVTPGQVIYFNIGTSRTGTSGNAANGNDTWVNKAANSAPTLSSNGIVAKGGASAVGTSAGIGSTTGCVGSSFNRGGSGRVGGAVAGGGGSGAGSSLNGTDATGTTGATAPAGGGNGGSGGATSGANGSPGSIPGGGGGGAYKNNTTTRNGGNGAAGQVILTYTAIPNCATVTSPTNGQTGVAPTTTLTWGAVSGATSYDVYFGTSATPAFVINQTGTSYTPSLLNYSTLYYWKIVAKNSAGDALSCSTWSFTTKAPGCLTATYGQYPSTTYTPNCLGTQENITTVGYAGEYSVVNVTSGVSYTFSSSVSTDYITISDVNGTSVLDWGIGTEIWTSTVNGSIRFYTHTNDACGSSATSRARRIQCSIPPNCAVISSPSDGSTGQSIGSTLNWQSVSNATSYDVYFGTSSNPPFVINQTGLTYSPTLNYNTTYYWKIVSKNAAGSATGCSTWSFTTGGPGCLNAIYGQYPSGVFNPSCPGTPENITTAGYASEYSMVTLINGVNYTFASSVSTDFITISDELGTTILAYGTGSITYLCPTDGDYRFYLHTNQTCGSSTTGRTRSIQCSTPPPPANDLIANAQNVGLCGGTFNNNTKFATQSGDGPSCYTAPSENWTAPGVWYTVVGNGQNITASLCGSNYDTKIFIYTGTPGNLACLTYNDDFCGTKSEVTFASTLNTTYYILVTGYGSAKGAFTLNVTLAPSNPVITTQPISGSVCAGQSRTFSVVASGNQGPLSYQWYLGGVLISSATSSSYTASSAGTYYVVVTNSCGASTQSNNATLTVNPLPNITVNSPEVCNGFSTTLTASGGTSYSWSTGATTSTISVSPTSTTNYTVTGTDANGCQNVATSTVTVNPNPTVSLNSLTSTICAGGSGTNNIIATPSSGTPTYSYQWQFFTGTTWSNTGTNTNTLNATPTVTREYRVIVTDSKGCQVTSTNHTVTVVPDPINPTLATKTPNQTDICVGTSVSATFNSGSGGVSCGDVFQFSTNGGSSWSTYIPGSAISTSGLLQGTLVQIRGRRTNCTSGIGCSANSWDILAQWSIVTPPILTTSSSQISCSGGGNGSINLTVSGSVGPFTFNWTGPNGFTSNLEDLTNLAAGGYTVVVSTPSGCSATTSVTVTEPASLVLTLIGGDALCLGSSNGSIDLTVSGGSPGYTYLWSNGQTTEDLTGLSAGGYTVTVTDVNSCVATSTVTISQPSTPVSITGTVTNVLCNGGSTGSIDITTSGGTPGYSYLWSSGQTTEDISGLSAGSYTVTATDDNGCSSNTVFNINQPSSITSSISVVNVNCYGATTGALNVTTSGGTPTYSYLWSNGMTGGYIYNLGAGSYSVTITDGNGCSSTNSATITQPTQIVLTTTKINVTCNGYNDGSITVSATGGTPPYTYNWSNGQTTSTISNLYSGNYNVFVTDSKGCTKTQMVNISQPSPISLSVNNPTISSCQTTPVTLTSSVSGGTPSYTYLWSNGATTPSISVQPPTATTQYTLNVTDIKGCVNSYISTITVNPSVGLPPLGSIYGPTQAYYYMVNSTTATYSVNPVAGASGYSWTIPNNGVSIIGQSNTNVLTVQFNSNFVSGYFTVSANGGCGGSQSDTLDVVVLQNPVISGDQCGIPSSSIKTYVVINSIPGLTYNWTPPYGAVLLSGQGNDTCKIKYSIYFQNSNLNVSVNTVYGTYYGSLQILRNASTPISINGPGQICADNQTVYEYYVDSVSTATGYIWGLPAGVTLVDGQLNDTIHVTFNTTYMSSNFNVQAYNQCGSSPMRYGLVDNQNLVLSVGNISGPTDMCPYIGSTATFSVVNQPGFSYTWTTPQGVSIVSGQGTNQVQLSIPYGFTSGQLSVKMNDGCGFTSPSTFNMTTSQQAITVSNITGLTNPCYIVGLNQTTTYNITAVANSTYSWSVPQNCQIVSGQGTNSIQVKFLTGFTSGIISVTVTPNCGSPVVQNKTITNSIINLVISGATCIENGQSYSYTINNTTGYNIQSFNWIPPGNATVTSGQGTSNVTIFYPNNFESNCTNNLCDSIRCYVQFPCSTSTVKRRIGMTTYPVSSIVGPSSTCGPDTIQLSVSSIPNRATNFFWGKPNGTQFISINGVPQTPTQGPSVYSQINTTFLGGNYNVQSLNQCGSSAMSYFYVSKVCPSLFVSQNPEVVTTEQSISTIDDVMTGVDYIIESNNAVDFIVYPNPGKGTIQLRIFRGNDQYFAVKIVNLLGQVKYFALKESEDSMNLGELESGLYFINVQDSNGNNITKELVISE